MLNTLRVKKSNGDKVDFFPGRIGIGDINQELEAKYCTCTAETENISEVPDWSTAEDVSYEVK